MDHFEHFEHHGYGLHPEAPQQTQYILDDDDHAWPVHSGVPSPPAAVTVALAAETLPPLPGVGAGYPGKPAAPVVPADLDEDEATESEDERRPAGGRGTSAGLAWQPQVASALRRPESAHTGTSQQPSPTPSVSLHAVGRAPAEARPLAGAPMAAAPKGGSKGGSKPRKTGGKGGTTLRLLIEEGVLQPGHNVLSVEYKGCTQLASLTADGRISSAIGGQHMVFESPSAFSIYLKRLVNPTRKADDGWKTVRYKNRVLEHFKGDLNLKRRLQEGTSAGGVSGAAAITTSEQAAQQQHWQQQQQQQHWQQYQQEPAAEDQQQAPARKRARVDSGSDLTGGSVAVSATVKEGDRNVLKLKFARPKKEGSDTADAALSQRAGEQPTTEYQRSRPRRQVQAPSRFSALGQDDEHALQPLEAYAEGEPGAPGAQPYSVYLSPVAEVVIDCHAHLSHSEVIGVLAGVFDPDTSSISVLRAYPVQEVSTEDNSINVEMDPEDEWRVRQQIDEEGLRVVGRYHSHPTFPTQPSTIDIYNQVLQQHQHRDEACSKEPYIAAIVGPYDKRQLAARSSLTCFYVDHPFGVLPAQGQRPDDVGCVAKVLQTLPLADGGGDSAMAEIANLPSSVLQKLALRYAARRDAVDLMGKWREGCSCAQKLIASLTSRLPSAQWTPGHLQAFSGRMQDMINSTLAHRVAPPLPGLAVEVGDGAAASGTTAAVASTPEQESEEEISDLDPDDC